MKKWGPNALETRHERKQKMVRQDLWGAGKWPEAQMRRRCQPGQELGAEGPGEGRSTWCSSPGWGQAIGSRNWRKPAWLEPRKGREEQGNMGLEDKQRAELFAQLNRKHWRKSEKNKGIWVHYHYSLQGERIKLLPAFTVSCVKIADLEDMAPTLAPPILAQTVEARHTPGKASFRAWVSASKGHKQMKKSGRTQHCHKHPLPLRKYFNPRASFMPERKTKENFPMMISTDQI